ncbi:MAG: sulfotransferase family 2 domain-containing protein [Cyanobacteria bacterium P01_A01_bin.17]
MMISHKYKVIFIHVPKCAGTSMEVFLKDYADAAPTNAEEGLEHFFKRHALVAVLNAYPDYFIFTFVRNPYERFVSAWKHSIRAHSTDESSYFYRQEKNLSLKEYAYLVRERDLKRLSGFDKYHSLPQIKFIPDFNTKMFGRELKQNMTCDFIGRFEKLENDFAKLCCRLQINTYVLPRYMVSPEQESESIVKSYGKYYDPELLRVVEDIYDEDFKRLGYSYNLNHNERMLRPREQAILRTKMMVGDIRKGIRKIKLRVKSGWQ